MPESCHHESKTRFLVEQPRTKNRRDYRATALLSYLKLRLTANRDPFKYLIRRCHLDGGLVRLGFIRPNESTRRERHLLFTAEVALSLFQHREINEESCRSSLALNVDIAVALLRDPIYDAKPQACPFTD